MGSTSAGGSSPSRRYPSTLDTERSDRAQSPVFLLRGAAVLADAVAGAALATVAASAAAFLRLSPLAMAKSAQKAVEMGRGKTMAKARGGRRWKGSGGGSKWQVSKSLSPPRYLPLWALKSQPCKTGPRAMAYLAIHVAA